MRDFLKKKSTSTWKMWTFTSHFLEKKWPYILEKGTFMHDFLKNVDLDPKNVNRYASFSEKVHLYLRNVDVLRMIFWKTWTFMYNFLKKVDLNAWGSAKSGPQLEKYGPLYAIFEKKGTLIWEMLSFTRDFLKNLDPNNANLLMWFYEKMLTRTSQACAWIIKKAFMM